MHYDALSSVSFAGGPPTRTDHCFAVDFAVVWIFAQSDERVSDSCTFVHGN